MALLLRKACQPILNDADLDPYHADLDANTKEMKLYTPCGKHLATVAGVLFGGLRPTKVEIEFATELLATWLLRNKNLLANFINETEVLEKMGEAVSSLNNFEIAHIFGRSRITSTKAKERYLVSIEQGAVKYCLDANGDLVRIELKETVSVALEHKLSKSNVLAGMSFLNEYLAISKQEKKVATLLAELNTCTK